jgi:Uma2 family endonuclease
MTALLTRPSRSIHRSDLPPGPKRYTVAEYHDLGELGTFESKRTCLIRGIIFEDEPMNPPHAIALELCHEHFRSVFGMGWRIRIQTPLPLGKSTDPQPDVAILRGSPRNSAQHPTKAELVMEISDTSFRFDTTEKLILYASAGIRDYWVLDVNDRTLYVFREPQTDGTYDTQLALKDTDSIAPLAAPEKTIRVADLLP